MAWIVVVVASMLPRVVLQELFHLGVSDEWRALVSGATVCVALFVAAAMPRLRPLAPFLTVLGVLIGAEWLVFRVIDRAPVFRGWLADPSFTTCMLAEQSLRLMVTLLVIAALLVIRRRPSRFFLTPGDLRAPMRAIPWLGVKDRTPWNRFGPIAAVGLSGGTLVFLLAAGRPSPDLVVQALPFLPAVFLTAALNAFNEEAAYKASLLSMLEGPLGPSQGLWMVRPTSASRTSTACRTG